MNKLNIEVSTNQIDPKIVTNVINKFFNKYSCQAFLCRILFFLCIILHLIIDDRKFHVTTFNFFARNKLALRNNMKMFFQFRQNLVNSIVYLNFWKDSIISWYITLRLSGSYPKFQYAHCLQYLSFLRYFNCGNQSLRLEFRKLKSSIYIIYYEVTRIALIDQDFINKAQPFFHGKEFINVLLPYQQKRK